MTLPWGHGQALRAGLELLVDLGGWPCLFLRCTRTAACGLGELAVDLGRRVAGSGLPAPTISGDSPGLGAVPGAAVLRPAKVTGLADGTGGSVTVVQAGRAQEYRARLVVGADGKQSSARRWVGADTIVDPEHHRFGGVALSGVQANSDAVGWAPTPGAAVVWFARESGSHRVYVRMTAERVRETGVGREVDSFVAFAAGFMPEGSMDNARQAGPLGFFPNSCTWPSHVAGGNLVLVGDAAGALDPSQGLGTSLLFRDVREISELLIGEGDWARATQEFATRRQAYYAVLRAYDLWCAVLEAEEGPEADRRRELHGAARKVDPTLGGFATLEAVGPDGLIPDETARRTYFGEPR